MISNPIGTLRIDVEPASAWDFGFGQSGSARSRTLGVQMMGAERDSVQLGCIRIDFSSLVVRSRGLEPPHPYGYMHLKHARLPIPRRPQIRIFAPTSSHTYLKLISSAPGWLSAAQTIEHRRRTGT